MIKKIANVCLLLLLSPALWAKPINIVAAENFYGDIAQKIGGSYVNVTSIMNNPNQDPHLFSSTPTIAKTIAQADLIVYNGIDYDSWMENLIKPNANQHKPIIVVAKLLGKRPGDNPHIWYDPKTMPLYVNALVEKLSQLDPIHKDYFQQQATEFHQAYQPILNTLSSLKQQSQGTAIIATEPVFNYMTSALGLIMYGDSFQLSMMNGINPSAKDTLDFEDKLNKHLVKVLIYNNQVTNPTAERLKDLAKKVGIPVVGISEIQPLDQDYFTWMNKQLRALQLALEA